MRFLVLVLLIVTVGCGGDIPRSKVHGKITNKGKPVHDATMVFLTEDKMNYTVELKADGSYEVQGIPRGKVEVSIQQHQPSITPRADPTKTRGKEAMSESKDADPERSPPPSVAKEIANPISPIYLDPKKSNLSFELKDPVQEWSVDLK